MACLLTLPAEVLHLVLSEIDPHDLAAVSGCCQDLNSYIKDNDLLYKEHYLKNWDLPLIKDGQEEIPWETDLKRFIRLQKLLACDSYDTHRSELPFLCETVIDHLKCALVTSDTSLNVVYLSTLFTTALYPLLASSSLYLLSHPAGPGANNTFEERQLAAKLHCYYGVPIQTDCNLTASPPNPQLIHPYARSRVYDLRRYTDNTFWGPFLDDGTGRVDWEKVEAIMIVLQFNLGYVSTREGGVFPLPMWEKPFLGCTPYSTVEQVKHCPSLHCDRPARQSPDSAFLNIGSITFTNGITESSLGPPPSLLKQPSLPTDLKDPYAITGTWMRVVCFLDYSELYNLNFDLDEEFHYTLDEKPDYDPSWTEEAVRMIVMRLKVTKLRAPNPDNGEIDYKGMPVAEFIGSSHSLHTAWDSNANSMIREKGTVRMTPDGEVRWTSMSVFHGEERWKSEGIQVGGPGAARGVIGNWGDKDHAQLGPAGPTAYWKWSDSIDERRIPRFRGM